MPYAMGTVVVGTPSSTSNSLTWGAASGGTGPYSYKVYRSTVSGFTPGPSNLIATLGVGVLSYSDTGLIANTAYFYVVNSIDTGAGNAVASSAQVAGTTSPFSQGMNQFAMAPWLGAQDQVYNYNNQNGIISQSVVAPLYPAQAVKLAAPPTAENQVPNYVPCTNANDPCCGFIVYSQKDPSFGALSSCTIARDGDVIYLMATANGSAGDYVELDLATVGGVKTGTPSDGNTVVAQAMDQPVAGQISRYQVKVPNKSLVF